MKEDHPIVVKHSDPQAPSPWAERVGAGLYRVQDRTVRKKDPAVEARVMAKKRAKRRVERKNKKRS